MLFTVCVLQPAVTEASVPMMMLLWTEPDGICRVGHGGTQSHREGLWTVPTVTAECHGPLRASTEQASPTGLTAWDSQGQCEPWILVQKLVCS